MRVPYPDVCITMTSPFDDREDHDVASAGSRVGYGDAAHFTREYKRLFGTLPPPHRGRRAKRDRRAGRPLSDEDLVVGGRAYPITVVENRSKRSGQVRSRPPKTRSAYLSEPHVARAARRPVGLAARLLTAEPSAPRPVSPVWFPASPLPVRRQAILHS
jgi:hypothetical protein